MSPNQCNMTCQCVFGVKRHTFKNGVFYIPLFVIFFLRNFRYPRAPALSHFSTKLHESFQTLSFFLFLFHYIISLHPQWNQLMFTLYWVQTSPISFVALVVQQRKQETSACRQDSFCICTKTISDIYSFCSHTRTVISAGFLKRRETAPSRTLKWSVTYLHSYNSKNGVKILGTG